MSITADPSYSIVAESDLEAVQRSERIAFSMSDDEIDFWKGRWPLSLSRVIRMDGEVQASLTTIPMNVYFNGGEIPSWCIASVCVPPEARGRGAGMRLMKNLMEEMHHKQVPISKLYPATMPLYRAVGYELAGHQYQTTVFLPEIELRDASQLSALPRVAPYVRAQHLDAVKRCYDRVAALHTGYLRRTDYLWGMILESEPSLVGWVIPSPDGSGVDGYIFAQIRKLDAHMHSELHVADVQCATKDAARALLLFLRGFAPLGRTAVLHSGTIHPLLTHLRDLCYRVVVDHTFAVRVTHVAAALKARPYPAALTLSVCLRVRDPLLSGNTGLYRVAVHDGQPTVAVESESQTAGAAAAAAGSAESDVVTVDVAALAQLYTGFSTAQQLRAAGSLSGSDRAVAAVALLFSCPTFSCPDYY